MHVAEEAISLIWPWIQYCESDPEDYRDFCSEEVRAMQLDLLKAVELIRLSLEPTKES